MLPLLILGIAAVVAVAVAVYAALTSAGNDADTKFGTAEVGKPVAHCPLEGQKIISPAQAQRANDKFDKLSPEEKEEFQKILDNAQSEDERMYIWKAFAACHSVDECSDFADKIRGKDADWMQDKLKLTGSTTGDGIQQQWSHSCNATAAQAIRGEMDPVYALKQHEDNPNFGSVDDSDATKENPNLAQEQKDMLEKEYDGPASGKHSGVAADRDDAGSGGGRWASDHFNDLKDVTGVEYTTEKDPDVNDAMDNIDAGVEKGVPVPIVIGNGPGQYTHYVVVTGSDPGPPKTYTIHDPWTGKTVTRTADDVENGKIDIAGSNKITAIENPDLEGTKPETTATC
jgi:hypothetical protein